MSAHRLPLVAPAVGRAENIAKRASRYAHPEVRLERSGSLTQQAAMLESQRMARTARQFRDHLIDPRTMTEHEHQVALFAWAAHEMHRYPELAALYAIPNGGHREKAVAGKLKASGVRRGVPDICLPVARGGFHALYIELKTPKGTPSSEQLEWRAVLRAAGNRAEIVKGWEAARDLIVRYLES